MPTYSHPPEGDSDGVRLVDHLHDVSDRVQHVVPEDATTPYGESVRDVVQRLALVHDLGKATTWFQQYIDESSSGPDRDRYRYHAQLGAFAAYYVLDEAGFAPETCYAGFVAVGRHHGRLPKPEEYVAKWTGSLHHDCDTTAGVVREQTKNVHDHARDLASSVFEEAAGSSDAWLAFARAFAADATLEDDIAERVVGRESVRDNAFSEAFYGLVLELWGSLVLADKTSAAGAPPGAETYEATQPSFERLDDHVSGLEDSVSAGFDGSRTERLNQYRAEAREDVLGSVRSFAESQSAVATITLPTGMGKTFTGLSAALKLRDELGSERVVYALPFTSIIDQVVDDVEAIFPVDERPGLLATHHHLADTRVTDDAEAADYSDDVAGMLGESWRAGLTVSTFVQLFESLAGPRNTQSMKVPALRDSVVVLDEPQSLPLDWWRLVPRLVRVLTEQYGATVVAMTATQPKLFPDRTELVGNVREYFEAAERVHYRLHESVERFLDGDDEGAAVDYDAAGATIVREAAEDTSVLAVCNTIDSARELTDAVVARAEHVDLASRYFERLAGSERPTSAVDVDAIVSELADTVESRDTRAFVHLSTRLRPVDRLALIQCVKELRERGVPVVAVTTQLVEAGVDVSFERVYRDIAPIDSLVQAAGRCNRSFEQTHGDVTVWWLAPPSGCEHSPAEAVYDQGAGPQLTPVAANALEDVRGDDAVLSDVTVARDAVEAFYDRLDERGVGRAEWADYVDTTEGESLASVSLIDTPRSVDVLVCVTDADRALVSELEAAYGDFDYERVDDLLDETKPLRVSVPIYTADSEAASVVKNLPPLGGLEEQTDIRVLDAGSAQFDQYFDETTGFVVDAGVGGRFF